MEKLEIIKNGIKNGIGFCAVYFCLTLLIKMCFLISIFLCFALVPKLVPRTVDFHWYWYRILKFWYRDNTTTHIYHKANPSVVSIALLTLLEPASVVLVSLIYYYSFS